LGRPRRRIRNRLVIGDRNHPGERVDAAGSYLKVDQCGFLHRAREVVVSQGRGLVLGHGYSRGRGIRGSHDDSMGGKFFEADRLEGLRTRGRSRAPLRRGFAGDETNRQETEADCD
jgi:hypothetical protein